MTMSLSNQVATCAVCNPAHDRSVSLPDKASHQNGQSVLLIEPLVLCGRIYFRISLKGGGEGGGGANANHQNLRGGGGQENI